ncbi:uncharacterized protein LOC110103694 [Dendrobium catenatum]|uniref:uncharacterized protein LOC110103694 n=1 Tax=Dendrobium catenatum TaxID=906689 RepID=UPI00109F1934|nr:uncharacterized protein LOC110103694 [Dendrobium catenatum]
MRPYPLRSNPRERCSFGGFTHSKSDPSLLLLRQQQVNIYLLIYVDDILLTGDNPAAITELLSKLNLKFAMKNLGDAHAFLGIQIRKHNSQYFLSQESYAVTILQHANLLDCNGLASPTCTKFPSDFGQDSHLSDPRTYRSITGALKYLTLTRPDIAFSTNLLSQHMHDPGPQHVYMLKHLLRYIKGTLDFGLPITKSNLILRSFSDADWEGDPISRKSTSGFCSFLSDTLISWTVKKQHTVARSSTESEYRSLAALTADIIWLKRILTDFGIPSDQPTDLFCDNTSAIALANNPVFHARTKHIEIDQRFVRDHITNHNIRLLPISTVDQVADILTKSSLSTPRFQQLITKLTTLQLQFCSNPHVLRSDPCSRARVLVPTRFTCALRASYNQPAALSGMTSTSYVTLLVIATPNCTCSSDLQGTMPLRLACTGLTTCLHSRGYALTRM